VCIPTLTDNLGNVYALGKWYTKEPPSAWVLREVAAEATALGHELIVEHVRGVDNTWADELSRGYLEGFSRSLRREPLLALDIGVHLCVGIPHCSSLREPRQGQLNALELQRT